MSVNVIRKAAGEVKITAALFEAGLKCLTKCFLLSCGERGSDNGYAHWVQAHNESYQDRTIQRLMAESRSVECVSRLTDAKNLTGAKWRLGMDLRAHSHSLESTIPVVERVSESQGEPARFVPIRFVYTNKLTPLDKVRVAFDALVLSKMHGRAVDLGKIVHGDDHIRVRVKIAALTGEVRNMVGRIGKVLSSQSPPDLVLKRHCGECEFQVRCRQKAIEKDDLSLLSSMTENERKRFNGKGIFTITQLSYTFRPRRRPKRLAAKKGKYHYPLKALSIRDKKIHIVGRPELNTGGTPVYLDVEGLPDRDSYYLIGVRIKTIEGIIQHSLWADKASAEKKLWCDFLLLLSRIENPVLIHYGSFETTFIKRMCDRYGKPTGETAVAKAIKSTVNLLSLIYAQIYFPTFSNGLKEIAGYLGFTWSDPSASGLETIAWRYEWEATGSPALKKALLTYNAQDCEALELVASKLSELCRASPESSSEDNVIRTERLERDLHRFKQIRFYFPELDVINKAAYWDYQRERIYVKSNAHLRGVSRRSTSKIRKVLRPNETRACPRPPSCPQCTSSHLHAQVKASKIVFDLKFMKNGIKRWIILYQFRKYRCQSCRVTFLPELKRWAHSRFGSGVAIYALYQNIELRLPLRVIASSMNKLFGLNLSERTVGRFKEEAAKIYGETYAMLVKRLCSGQLIHVDETKINVRGGGGGYVWVLANIEEVAYIYSETRQGDTLRSLLKDFTGVLVTDFYAAYDGIQCAQQKCLIHLIRDLNDAVLEHPYDEELKNLVRSFANLVKQIVETVDRHGLKSRFLKKHLVSVRRFYRHLSQKDLQSEPARSFKERFMKNRDKLFTFLVHDGVPWNNNNAEHTIKAFASLRRVIDGLTSEKGIREYLVMLSIAETCKYKGVEFLDFLRSGEKDMHAFAESKRRRAKQ